VQRNAFTEARFILGRPTVAERLQWAMKFCCDLRISRLRFVKTQDLERAGANS